MSRGPVVAAWAVATLIALAALAEGPGVSRDEAAVVASAQRGFPFVDPAPPLAPALAAGAHAAAAAAGLPHLGGFRLGSALAGALLSALLAAAGFTLAGTAGGFLAPALFWLAPRHLHAGLVATPELALAALSLAAVLAWRRACAAASRGRALWPAALAGALLGAAVLARADAWALVPALALHAAACHALARRAPPAAAGRGAVLGHLLLAAAVAAGIVVAAWPAVLRAGRAPWLPPPGGALAPVLPLLTVPAALLWAYAGGAAHAVVRLVRAARSRAPAAAASDDALLLLAALAALAGSALAHAPQGGRPTLHAMPFLALLGARAVVRAAALAWPSGAHPLAAALSLALLFPAARATVRAHPNGAAAWNELAGGAAGAASLGLRRQDGGEAAAALLAAVNDRAGTGVRIWWPGTATEAIVLYARDHRLRPDLELAGGPEEADLAVVTLDGGSRDAEYRTWSAFRTSRPAAGFYVDEVPVALVYARGGAWR